MSLTNIQHCPGTLAENHTTFSRTALKKIFNGKKINHILSYDSPLADNAINDLFDENRVYMSLSGVQEKFSLLLDKNTLRLTREGEIGTYILKPIPLAGKNKDQMPANEHLTMQIAKQVFGIETAENALIFFQDGSPGYITKRFDVNYDGTKRGQDDFASLEQKTAQTHGSNYKYTGHYLALFECMKKYLNTYPTEAPKLFQIIMFNYLFSNGDAHLKNFSILETNFGDYRLSPAYDLLNSRIHVSDKDFALDDGLLPRNLTKGKIASQFALLAELADIPKKTFQGTLSKMTSQSTQVEKLIQASFLNETIKRNYLQAYRTRLKQLMKS